MEPVLKLKQIGFAYDTSWVLKEIDLNIFPGEALGILGPNGSGKSTLLKLMSGTLRPKKGDVILKDRNMSSYSRAGVAREIAMVAQENHFQFSFSVLEVVLMGRFAYLNNTQFEGKHDLEIVENALNSTHALDLSKRPIHELSGGEKQRVLLARALAQEPSVILLDEVTSFLDLRYKKEIFDLVSSLTRDKGVGVVMVSHDIDLVARYCDRVVLIKGRNIYSSGVPVEVITDKAIEFVYECPVIVDSNPAAMSPRVSLK